MTPNDLLGPKHGLAACRRATGISLLLTTLLCGLHSQEALAAEARSTSGGFVPGSRELFSMDFSQEPLGGFPHTLRSLRGSMAVVDKDGQRMLQASDNAEFLVALPERLPEHFTLEFDLVTRFDYNTEEIGFEGTPTFNRGPESANVLFYRTDVSVLGGREAGHAYIKIPPDIAAELQGQPAEFRADVNGTTVTLYANGRQIASLPDVKFVRGRVLRVFLGGQDSDMNAVHLSRLRIADAGSAGTGTATPVVTQQGTPTGGPMETPTLPTATTTPTASPAITPTLPTTATGPTPAVLQRASTGPGTQTEDDVYVGTRRTVEGATSPLTTAPQVPADAGTSPNTGITTSRTSTISSGGEGDLDELEVERRTVQGVTGPLTTAPQVPSGSGTSPNTGITTSRTSTIISSGGGDGDLDDLEVERRTVQGVTSPVITTSPVRPDAGTSPDSGASLSPESGTPLP